MTGSRTRATRDIPREEQKKKKKKKKKKLRERRAEESEPKLRGEGLRWWGRSPVGSGFGGGLIRNGRPSAFPEDPGPSSPFPEGA